MQCSGQFGPGRPIYRSAGLLLLNRQLSYGLSACLFDEQTLRRMENHQRIRFVRHFVVSFYAPREPRLARHLFTSGQPARPPSFPMIKPTPSNSLLRLLLRAIESSGGGGSSPDEVPTRDYFPAIFPSPASLNAAVSKLSRIMRISDIFSRPPRHPATRRQRRGSGNFLVPPSIRFQFPF